MISVIVPMYNSEKHLEQCISSIVKQSFSDIEILLIDDGSVDRSTEICRKFAMLDSRIKYYHKENGGAASARNYGISQATGDYVAFVDSDDFIGRDYLKILAEQTISEDYTIIQCGMTLEKGDSRMYLSHKETKCNRKEYVWMVVSRQIPMFLFQSTVCKLYKRSVIVENDLLFDEQVSLSEDCLFNTRLMPFVDAYCYVNCNDYFYNKNNGDSLTHNKKRDFKSVSTGIDVGIITSAIRNNCIVENQLQYNPEILRGFQNTVCIIYLSNANTIEESDLNFKQKKQLYEMYFTQMNYPIDEVIKEYSGTDEIILNASKNKNYKIIHGIYKLRSYKRKLLNCLRK